MTFTPAPKPEPKKRGKEPASQADLDYMLAVKGLPCAVCNAPPPSDCHHTICGRFGSRKTPARDCIPLCKIHHQWGPDAIHNGKESWIDEWGFDTNYIEQTRAQIDAISD